MTDLTPDQFLGGGPAAPPSEAPHKPGPKYTAFQGKGATPEQFLGTPVKPPSNKPTFDWKGAWDKVASAVGPAAQTVDSLIEDPTAQREAVKALALGAIEMGSAAVGGLKGGYEAARGGDFRLNAEQAQRNTERMILSHIGNVNLAPEGKQGEATTGLLQALPNGIKKLGEVSNDASVRLLEAVGTDKYHAALGGALAEAGITGLATVLTFKPEIALKAFKPILTEGKLSKTLETSFDGLAAKDPAAAADIIKHIDAAPEEPPTSHLVQPGAEGWEPRETPEAQKAAVVAKLKVRLKAKPAEDVIGAERVNAQIGDSGAKAAHAYMLWDETDLRMEMRGQFKPTEDTTAHKFLRDASAATSNPYAKGLLERIRATVDDVPIKHTDFATHPDAENYRGRAGVYWSGQHKIDINSNSQYRVQTAVHELVHAGTVQYMHTNPASPLTLEISRLRRLAVDRAKRMDAAPNRTWSDNQKHYGLTDDYEFIAESLSNPNFQRWLVDSEEFAGPSQRSITAGGRTLTATTPQGRLQSITSRLSGIIQKIFKITDPGQAKLLHNIFAASDRILDAQKQMGMPTTEQVGSGLRSAIQDVHGMSDAAEPKPLGEDPTLYLDKGRPVSQGKVEAAFRIGSEAADKIPGMGVAKGELRTWYDWAIRKVNPEALGPQAKLGAAIIAKNIAIQAQHESSYFNRSATRRTYWNMRQKEARDFIAKYESGASFADPVLNKAMQAYRNWNTEIFNRESKLGLEYEPQDNYLYHTYKDSDAVAAFLQKRFGNKWGDPGFIKDRAFTMYEEARKAGFTPKYENPEDIMLARQHASDIAEMQTNILQELEQHGLAVKREKGSKPPEDFPAAERRAPNGDRYWVHSDAFQVLHNAFDSKSLWADQSPVGKTFRGAMWLKNTIVPIKLAASLFHPIHVATIHNVTGMVRASKEMLSGRINPAEWLGRMTAAALYTDFISAPAAGGHILRAFQGKIPEAQITAADRQSLTYMAEGGMIPELSSQYRTKAWQNFKDAVDKRELGAAFKLPFAVLDKVQGIVFQHWIPSLKTASYLKDVQSALKSDPTLSEDSGRRMQAFRRLAKSVDNRYGEMAYNTLFWDRTIKDLAVANTLSLGWQMGFLREYGGGALDVGQWIGGGSKLQQVRSGKLDRPLFVAMYTTQAMLYGGLLTWAMTGKPPESFMDYINPRVGEDAQGKPKRVSTMFYPREFMSIWKHVQAAGAVKGVSDLVASKASGVIGLSKEWATGVDSFGQEIADPNAPLYKQLEQKMAYTLVGLEPISLASPASTGKDRALAIAGFSPAPKYITQSDTQNRISEVYRSRYAPRETPFDKAQQSADMRALKEARSAGDMDAYDKQLDHMQDKYGLTGAEMNKLRGQYKSKSDPNVRMFSSFTWQDQRALLDKMTPEERETYLPHSNKDHLRRKYKPPEGD